MAGHLGAFRRHKKFVPVLIAEFVPEFDLNSDLYSVTNSGTYFFHVMKMAPKTRESLNCWCNMLLRLNQMKMMELTIALSSFIFASNFLLYWLSRDVSDCIWQTKSLVFVYVCEQLWVQTIAIQTEKWG